MSGAADGYPDWTALSRWMLDWWRQAAGAGAPDAGSFWRSSVFTPPFGAAANPFAAWFAPWMGDGRAQTPEDRFADDLRRWLEQLTGGSAGNTGGPFAGFGAPFDVFGAAGEPPFGPFSPIPPSEIAALFDLPPLGATREWAVKWRDVQRAAKAELEARAALGRQIASVHAEAMKRFLRLLRENDPRDGEITSLRGLYDCWIDLAEHAYHDIAMTPAYSKAFGRYINASAGLRRAWQTLADDWLEAMNLPNRRELDALTARQHEIDARLRAVESESDPAFDVDALTARQHEIDARLCAVESKSDPAFDVDALVARVRALEQRVASSASTERSAARDDEDSPRRKRAAPARKPRAKRAAPRKASAKAPRTKPKSRARPSKPTGDEFDIGNLR